MNYGPHLLGPLRTLVPVPSMLRAQDSPPPDQLYTPAPHWLGITTMHAAPPPVGIPLLGGPPRYHYTDTGHRVRLFDIMPWEDERAHARAQQDAWLWRDSMGMHGYPAATFSTYPESEA